jgi:hypothetical protein
VEVLFDMSAVLIASVETALKDEHRWPRRTRTRVVVNISGAVLAEQRPMGPILWW